MKNILLLWLLLVCSILDSCDNAETKIKKDKMWYEISILHSEYKFKNYSYQNLEFLGNSRDTLAKIKIEMMKIKMKIDSLDTEYVKLLNKEELAKYNREKMIDKMEK